MGEVWKGRDTRLDRSVAIKVLPAEFANNAQLRLRLEREAKSISQLNHPHICTLYDVGRENDVEYLVMEYMEGQTLADRLTAGPLPLDQVIRHGVEIAEALERAHKAGIVHRDLKPANVMLTKSGAKLLDFGLAKSSTHDLAGNTNVSPDDATAAAMAVRPLTEEGTIVGTFQYMAPEQIEGRDADARTDIFALGALLYEMVTGRRAFDGKSKASLIASILATEPPPLSASQPASPLSLDRLIRTCLAKEPDERWQSAHDVALQLRRLREEASIEAPGRRPSRIGWVVAACAAAVAITASWFALHRSAPPSFPAIESGIAVPQGWMVRWPRLSPDGMRIAFVGMNEDGESALFLRELASGKTTRLPITDAAGTPEWSPDGRELLIRQSGVLVRHAPESGATQIVSHAAHGNGYAWGANGVVLISTDKGIERTTITGGATQVVIAADPAHGEVRDLLPVFLPDGEHFLYLSMRRVADQTSSTICVSSLDGRTRHDVVAADGHGQYANGFLLFSRSTRILAQPFDLKSLTVSGDAKVIGDELMFASPGASSAFSVSSNGLLIYRRAASVSASSRLVWFDRNGAESGTLAPVGQYWDLSLSHDGRFVAVQVTEPQQPGHIWSYDVTRNVSTLLTPPSADAPELHSATPIWLPDGRSLAFISGNLGGKFDVCVKQLDGGQRTVLHNGLRNYVCDVTADGRTAIVTTTFPTGTQYSLGALRLDSGALTQIGPKESSRLNAKLSPDQHWMAYVSNDTGRREVYVSPYPDARIMTRISANGGQMPYWSADGRKLYYASGDLRQILVTDLRFHDGTVDVGEPRVVIRTRIKQSENTQFIVMPDEQRILVNVVENDTFSNPLTLLSNWMARVGQ